MFTVKMKYAQYNAPSIKVPSLDTLGGTHCSELNPHNNTLQHIEASSIICNIHQYNFS